MFKFLRRCHNILDAFFSTMTGGTRNNVSASANFKIKPFLLYKLKHGPPETTSITRDEGIRFYEEMYTIRIIEEHLKELFHQGHIRGALHLSSGQEAIAVGLNSILRKQDAIITSYRIHGWVYLMGVDHLGVIAEMIGKRTGSAKGKGGSMHLYYNSQFYGGHGIVGAQVPLGAGIAFAKKYQGTDGVCLAMYGDGASNQGQVFETFNMAKLLNLPCVFVCENNHYGKFTSARRSSANTNNYTRGDYIPGIWVDGMDVLSVREAGKFALNYCLSGKGPILLEMDTYIYYGPSVGDPSLHYRTPEEIQRVRKTRDPVASFRQKLKCAKLATDEELQKIEMNVNEIVDKAKGMALSGTELRVEQLTVDIYAECLEKEIRSVAPRDYL